MPLTGYIWGMSEVLQANIFFYITSVAVIVVTVLLAVVLVYVLLIVRNVKDITDRVREGSELLANDLGALRDRLQTTGLKFQQLGALFFDRLFRRKRTRRKNAKQEETASEE